MCYVNIAYLDIKLIEKLNEMMFFGISVHSMVFQLRLVEEKFTSSSASIKSSPFFKMNPCKKSQREPPKKQIKL